MSNNLHLTDKQYLDLMKRRKKEWNIAQGSLTNQN